MSQGTEQGVRNGWPSLASACLSFSKPHDSLSPFTSRSCQKSKVTTFALGPEHSQSYNMHKTVTARQGEYDLSSILSLETP